MPIVMVRCEAHGSTSATFLVGAVVVTILILHFDRGGGRPTRLMWKIYTCAMAGFDEVLYVELSRQFDRVYNIIIHASPFPLIVLQHTFFIWFSLYHLMTFFIRTQINTKKFQTVHTLNHSIESD